MRNGLEQSAPTGMPFVHERTAPADVFVVKPTTYHGSEVWNAPFDFDDGEASSYEAPVLIGQAYAVSMAYIGGHARDQGLLLASVEDYVAADSPGRLSTINRTSLDGSS